MYGKPSILAAAAVLVTANPARSEPVPEMLDPLEISARRLPDTATDSPFSLTELDRTALERSPGLELDEVLRNELPGFGLFRRTPARVAHPTTQGVSLRNLGPNGAGRTLVLLDGVPLNDPFGGWVNWQRVPPDSLERIIVKRGGGAGLYGNAALGGSIFLESRDPQPGEGALSATLGTDDTYAGSVQGAVGGETVTAGIYARHFRTGGFPVIRADQRGPVDTEADVRADLVQGRLLWELAGGSELEFFIAGFREERGNGTRLTRNASEGVDLAVAWSREMPEREARTRWQIYYQDRQFESLFTAVNDARTTETPALDQFRVPSESLGGSATWSQVLGGGHTLVLGADLRRVTGETRENYFFNDGTFLRNRVAGGEQFFAGIFAEDRWEITPRLRVVSGLRLDYVKVSGGSRIERDRTTGEILSRESFEDREHLVPNGQLGMLFDATDQLAFRAALTSGFRQPTLNELYRPFRVGSDITEANAALDPERLLGIEAGLTWEPVPEWTLALTGFHNRLHDAVGNVTIAEGPGRFEVGGFVPAGGILRQRRNLERVDVSGLEARVEWRPDPCWRVTADYLYTRATIADAGNTTALEGRALAQAPRHVAVAGIDWLPTPQWRARLQGRYTGPQFEDDLNSRELDGFTTIDMAVGFSPTERLSLELAMRNLFDTGYETGIRGDGVVSIGAPRQVELTVTHRF